MPKRLDSISRQPKSTSAPEADKEVVTTTPEPTEKTPEQPAEEKVVEEPKTEEKATTVENAEAVESTPAPEAVEATPEAVEEEQTANKDSFENLFPEPSIVMSGPPGWVWWLLLIIGAAGLGFVAFDVTRGKIDTWLSISPEASPSVTATATATPSANATPTETPTPTPSATTTTTPTGIDKSKITLRVLNGTTVSGAAASTKTTLENAGFTVRTVGNAKNQTYKSTMVYYQAGKEAEAQAVADALAPTKTTLEQSTLANPDMVLVVVGTNK